MFYTIGEMAQRLNVAPSTLRYYDKEGLLPFVERSSGGQSVLDQQRQLEDTLLMLDYKRWYYQTAQEAGTCAVHDTMALEQVPERFRALAAEWKTEV